MTEKTIIALNSAAQHVRACVTDPGDFSCLLMAVD